MSLGASKLATKRLFGDPVEGECSEGNHWSHMGTNYFSCLVHKSTMMISGIGCCGVTYCVYRFWNKSLFKIRQGKG